MICAKPGWSEPMVGQTVYVVFKDGEAVGACLRTTDVVRKMQAGLVDDFKEVPWLG